MSFYDEVLRELLAAIGAALFIGNLVALFRRRADRRRAAQRAVAKGRPGSPVRAKVEATRDRDQLPQAPLVRTIAYVLLGFVVMIWAVASLTIG